MSDHIIRNWETLATSPLRRDAMDILEAGLSAIETGPVVRESVRLAGEQLRVKKETFDLAHFDNIYVVGIGKAALEAAQALEEILGENITDGIVLDVQAGELEHMTSIAGTHPYPSLPNMRAAGEIMAILKQASERDLVIAIVSGGGSALLSWPHELNTREMTDITKQLFAEGATIQELNTVRKHISEIQGGQFVEAAHPSTILGLIFSDVPGDNEHMVASGPTYLDTSTVQDAENVLAKYDVLRTCQIDHCQLHETPKDPGLFARVRNQVLVDNTVAARAMTGRADELGYIAQLYSTRLTGEAREVGKMLAKLPGDGEALVAAGETTVTITGSGKGGRNLEVALGALEGIADDALVAAIASDGIDNTEWAGALVDKDTRARAAELGLEAADALSHNRSFDFFRQVGSYFETGPTGTNVSDLILALRRRS